MAVFVGALFFTPNAGDAYLSGTEIEQTYAETEELNTGQTGNNQLDSIDGGDDHPSAPWSKGSAWELSSLRSASCLNEAIKRHRVDHFPYYILYCNLKIPAC